MPSRTALHLIIAAYITVVRGVTPNVPPFFVGPNPAVVDVDEDSTGYSPVTGFLTGITVGDTGNGLATFPGMKQDWWLDVVIVEQHPPLPTRLFIDDPKLNPDTGSCATTCPSGVCTPPVCTPTTSNLEFTIQPNVSGYVIVEITLKDSGGMYPGTDEYKQRVQINISDINDGVPTFTLSSNGTRLIEVYEDTCNSIKGWVHDYNLGSAYEEFAGDTLDYQLFPTLGYSFQRDIFVNKSIPYQCGNRSATCPVGPTGPGHGHGGIDVTFPDGTLEFCLAQDQVDTVGVTMACIDQCSVNQTLKPAYMGIRDWPCWDPATYRACPDAYFEISVIPVNDPPGRCPEVSTVTVSECTAAANAANGGCSHSFDVYPSRPASNRRPYIMTHGGGPDEANQQVDVRIETKEPSIYELTPQLDPDAGRLTFKLKTYANTFDNRDVLTVIFHDDGGVANRWCSGAAGPGSSGCPAGSDSTECKVEVVIKAVNQPPLWTPGPDVAVDEDAGLTRVPGFASKISPGEDPSEKDQKLSFTCTANPAGVLEHPPTIEPLSGDLVFQTAVNANGVVQVTCGLSDQIDSTPHTFTLTVNPINDCPVLNLTSSQSVCMEGHVCEHPLNESYWGADNENTQSLSYDVWLHPMQGGHELFESLPSADGSGWLRYQCKEGVAGVTTVRVTVRDDGGGVLPNCDKGEPVDLTITCKMANRRPSFVLTDKTVEVWEGSGGTTVDRFATTIDKGDPSEGWQDLTFALTSTNSALYSTPPAIDPTTGTLTFDVLPGASGNDSVTAVLYDNGGENNASVPAVFRIVVRADEPPSFTPGGALGSLEDTASVTVLWATDISSGGVPGYRFSTDSDCGAGYLKAPLTITQDSDTKEGIVSFEPKTDANGEFSCDVCVVNDKNMSGCHVLNVTIYPVNDPPVFELAQTVITMNEDQDNGVVTFKNIIKSPSPGPQDEVDAGQLLKWSVDVVTESSMVLEGVPAVVAGSDLKVGLVKDAHGEGAMMITAVDYQLNTVSRNSSKRLLFKVNEVNDAPYFTPGANITLDATSPHAYTARWATAISAGAPDEDTTQTASFAVIPIGDSGNGSLLPSPPQLSPDGVITIPPPVQGASGVARYAVRLTDTGVPPMSSPEVSLWVFVGAHGVYEPPAWVTKHNDSYTVEEDAGLVVLQNFGVVKAAPRPGWETQYAVKLASGSDLFEGAPSVSSQPDALNPRNDVLTLRFMTKPNRFGTAAAEMIVTDSASAALMPTSFVIVVAPVNDAPSFVPINRLTVLRYNVKDVTGTGVTVRDWLRRELVTAGPYEDATQKVSFSAAVDGVGNGVFVEGRQASVDGADLVIPLSGTVGKGIVTVEGIDDVPGDRLKTYPVNVTVSVTEKKEVVTTQLRYGLEGWEKGSGGGTAADVEVAKLKVAEAEKRLEANPDDTVLAEQLAVLKAALEALEGAAPRLGVGDMLGVQDENLFVDDFRANISTAMGIPLTDVEVLSVTKSLAGTQVVWSIPGTPDFMSQKSVLQGGLYVNSTTAMSTPTPQQDGTTPTPGSAGNTSAAVIALVVIAMFLSGLFLCVAAYLYRQKKRQIETVRE